MKKILLAGFLLGISVCVPAQPQEALKRLVGTAGLKNAAIGVSVKQVSDGKIVAGYNPQMALAPASVVKLLSTAFAWSEKGNAYRYQTDVFYHGSLRDGVLGGDLVVAPGGDPSLESSYFKDHRLIASLVETIRQKGIRVIQGGIRVDAPENGGENTPGTWVWEDISNYYGACYLPFNYRDNLYTLELKSGAAGGKVELTRVVPEVPGIGFRNEVHASVENRDNAWIYGGPYSPVRHIRGTIPQNRDCFKVKGAMPDPAACFVKELTGELERRGVKVEGEASLAGGEGKTKLLTWMSPELEDIVWHTNKSSVNLFAEALGCLAVGEAGVQEGMSALLRKAGIDAGGVTLKDACGLSPMNAVPAQVFTDLLVWADGKLGMAFVNSLPVAGIDGGLSGYYGGNTILKNNLKAKTGSFSGVRCLSGYLTNRSGNLLAFTILINHYTCPAAGLQQAVSLFLAELAKS